MAHIYDSELTHAGDGLRVPAGRWWDWWAAGLILAVGFSIFVFYAIDGQGRPAIDDAAINYRYVLQIASGHGVRYSVDGPLVYGASALPYTLILALLYKAGLPMHAAGLVLNFGGLAVTVMLVFRMCTRRPKDQPAFLPPLMGLVPCVFVLLTPRVITWSTQDLECGFHVMLCMLAVFAFTSGKSGTAGVFLGLSLADKLDAASLVAALACAELLFSRRVPWRMLVAFALTYLPWALLTWHYFGSPLPMSLQAKKIHEFASGGHLFIHEYFDSYQRFFWPLVLLVFARNKWVIALLLWFVFYVLLYDHVTRGYPFHWYFYISDLLSSMLTGIALARTAVDPRVTRIVGRVLAEFRVPGRTRFSPAVYTLGAFAIVFVYIGRHQIREARNYLAAEREFASTVDADRVAIGDWIHGHSQPSDTLYTAYGWITYRSGLSVFDGSCLNDAAMLAAEKEGRKDQHLSELRPTFMVDNGYQPPIAIRSEYVLIGYWNTTKQIDVPHWVLWGRLDSKAVKALDPATLPLVFNQVVP